MGAVKVSIVHKLSGEIVAVSHATASIDGMELEGIAIPGSDESVITADIEEDDLMELYRTHIVMGQELRAKDSSATGSY
jgi:hypothetical protein